MENKYQEALDRIKNKVAIIDDEKMTIGQAYFRTFPILQELVDKETPMKPEWLGGAMTGEPKLYCPKCSYCVNDTYLNKYRCRECNQKLDWSDK